MKHALCTTLASLCLACAGVSVRAQTAPPMLPPADTVARVLGQLPQVQAAGAGIFLAQARSQRLQAGPHDWVAKATADRRSERAGERFSETEIALETGVRWPAKVAADRQLGTVEVQLGELGHADAWHEAARGLLADWFETLRDLRSANLLEAQHLLIARQWTVTQRRLQAGEAAALELLTANAEEARMQALATRARAQAHLRSQTLQRRYPGLPDPAGALSAPMDPWPTDTNTDTESGAVAAWVTRILEDNHELERAQARAEQARLQAQRSQLEQRADPTVGVRATRERSGQERVLGVYLSVPLGGAGRRADTQAALAQADMAEQELAQTRQRVEAEAWRTASEAEQSLATLSQQRRALEQLQKSAALQARAYALGESPLTELLMAQRSALEVQLVAETAALDAMQARARLLLDAHRLWVPPGH